MATTVKNILYILFMVGFISFFVFLYRIIRQGEKDHQEKHKKDTRE